MNRIENRFLDLRSRDKKAFIAFVTAGDPALETTERLVLAFEKSGVDIVELGVPFSDPLADGPTIQAASQRALRNGVTVEKIFESVRRIRRHSEIPLALMVYYNIIFHYGENAFVAAAKGAGVDGLVFPDLPPEEAEGLILAAREAEISTVFFISPTTTRERMKKIISASTGFIYYVSITGVTGARQSLPAAMLNHVKAVKRLTDKPVCVGFGVSTAEQVKAVTQVADGVIVGSAIIKEIEKHEGRDDLVASVSDFVKSLTSE